MRLELDIGNTRVKWRLLDQNSQVVERGEAYTADELEALSQGLSPAFINGFPTKKITGVALASVVPEFSLVLKRWFAENIGVSIFLAEVQSYCAGVTNAYEVISQMGIDRWLGMLAAYHRVGSSVLIVDVGSAITIDAVRHDGVHLGGYIAPGLDMMNHAMFSNTGRVRVVSQEYAMIPQLGCSTEAAVVSALPVMGLGLIQYAYRELVVASKEVIPQEVTPQLIVTGGNGRYYSRLLVENGLKNVELIEDLVLDGLKLAESQHGSHSNNQVSD